MKKIIIALLVLLPSLVSAQIMIPAGGTGTTTFQIGTIPFGASVLRLTSDSRLFWDNTLKRLGLGTTTPGTDLAVAGLTGILTNGPITSYGLLSIPSLSATTSATNIFGGPLRVSPLATSTFSGDILARGVSAWSYLNVPFIQATSTTASTLPYASTTAFTVSGAGTSTRMLGDLSALGVGGVNYLSTGRTATTTIVGDNGTSTISNKLSVANLAVTGNSAGCAQFGAGGFLLSTGSSCAASAGSPFTFTPNFGTGIMAATTSPIWLQGGLYASTTAQPLGTVFFQGANFATTTIGSNANYLTIAGDGYPGLGMIPTITSRTIGGPADYFTGLKGKLLLTEGPNGQDTGVSFFAADLSSAVELQFSTTTDILYTNNSIPFVVNDSSAASSIFLTKGATNDNTAWASKFLNSDSTFIGGSRNDSQSVFGNSSAPDFTYGGSAFKANLNITSDAQSSFAGLSLLTANATAGNGSTVLCNRSRGTIGSKTVVSSGDTLCEFVGLGYDSDSTTFQGAASILFQVDGTPGANDMPGRIVFKTSADGSANPVETMRLSNVGNLGIATTSPGTLLSVSTNINFTNATSSFKNGGINLNAGCFAINGVCLTDPSLAGFNATSSSGTRSIASTGDQVITHNLGSIPEIIRINAMMSRDNTTNSSSFGTYSNGLTNTVFQFIDTSGTQNSSDISTDNIITVTGLNAGTPCTGTAVIGSITSTQFTLTWSRSNSCSGTANFVWTVEK